MNDKKLTSLKKRVLKKSPNSILKTDKMGDFYITAEDISLMQKYMIPHTETEYDAWYSVWECLRTEQNIRRSNPLKSVFYHDKEKKSQRIRNRISGRKSKTKSM